MSQHTKDRVTVDTNYDTDGPIAICTTGRGWEEIGEAHHLLGKGREEEKLANARLFADAINVANETGMGPRELAAERKRMLEIILVAAAVYKGMPAPKLGEWNWPDMAKQCEAVLAKAENSKPKATP